MFTFFWLAPVELRQTVVVDSPSVFDWKSNPNLNKSKKYEIDSAAERKAVSSQLHTIMTSSSERQKFEYESESELESDYKKIVLSSPVNVQIATDHLYDSILEEAVMGIAFHMHFQSKHPVSTTKL